MTSAASEDAEQLICSLLNIRFEHYLLEGRQCDMSTYIVVWIWRLPNAKNTFEAILAKTIRGSRKKSNASQSRRTKPPKTSPINSHVMSLIQFAIRNWKIPRILLPQIFWLTKLHPLQPKANSSNRNQKWIFQLPSTVNMRCFWRWKWFASHEAYVRSVHRFTELK